MMSSVHLAEAATTLDKKFSVRSKDRTVIAECGSLLAALETSIGKLDDGDTVECDGRVLATFVISKRPEGEAKWKVWWLGDERRSDSDRPVPMVFGGGGR